MNQLHCKTCGTDEPMHICNAIIHMNCGSVSCCGTKPGGQNPGGEKPSGETQEKDCRFEGTHTYYFRKDLIPAGASGGETTTEGELILDGEWKRVPNVPSDIQAGTLLTEHMGKLYFLSGNSSTLDKYTQYCEKVQCFDPATESWGEPLVLPQTVLAGTLFFYEEKLYLFAYTLTSPNASVVSGYSAVYDFSAKTWSPLPSPPLVQSQTTVCVIDSKAYLYGGFTSGSVDKVQCFDLNTNSWGQPEILGFDAYMKRGVGVNGRLFLPGGAPDRSIAIFDISSGTCRYIAGCEYYPIYLDIYDEHMVLTSSREKIEVYNSKSDSWNKLPPAFATGRSVETAIVCGKLYMIDYGRAMDDSSPNLSVYDLGVRATGTQPPIPPTEKPLLTLPKGASVWGTQPCSAGGVSIGNAGAPTVMPKRAEFTTADLAASQKDDLFLVVSQPTA